MSFWKSLFKKEADKIVDEVRAAEEALAIAQKKIDTLKESYPIDFMIKEVTNLVKLILISNEDKIRFLNYGDYPAANRQEIDLQKKSNDLNLLLIDIRSEFDRNKKCLS